MTSIRTYGDEIRVCTDCGQPAFLEGTEIGEGWFHFDEQRDGVFCPNFPLARNVIQIGWDQGSLKDLKEWYPNTSPDRQGRHAFPWEHYEEGIE